jgi:hypothetical protein
VNVVKIRDTDTKNAAETLIVFVGELRDKLSSTEDEIEEKLAKNDYDALGKLSLEDDSK